MKARNKHTGKECEIWWMMCDVGRKCSATDKPNHQHPEEGFLIYNAVVDDYELYVNDKWVDGLEFLKKGWNV